MATRWPTEILQIGMPARPTWGRVYGVREEGDVSEEDYMPEETTWTAQADIRGGTARVGETLVDMQGRTWAIVSVEESNSYYGGGTRLELQQEVKGVGD